jgi:hypothetical protein
MALGLYVRADMSGAALDEAHAGPVFIIHFAPFPNCLEFSTYLPACIILCLERSPHVGAVIWVVNVVLQFMVQTFSASDD